jgi:hypothetical protein
MYKSKKLQIMYIYKNILIEHRQAVFFHFIFPSSDMFF